MHLQAVNRLDAEITQNIIKIQVNPRPDLNI